MPAPTSRSLTEAIRHAHDQLNHVASPPSEALVVARLREVSAAAASVWAVETTARPIMPELPVPTMNEPVFFGLNRVALSLEPQAMMPRRNSRRFGSQAGRPSYVEEQALLSPSPVPAMAEHALDCDCQSCAGVSGTTERQALTRHLQNHYGIGPGALCRDYFGDIINFIGRMESVGILSYQASMVHRWKFIKFWATSTKTMWAYVLENGDWFQFVGPTQLKRAKARLGENHPKLVDVAQRAFVHHTREDNVRRMREEKSQMNLERFITHGGSAKPSYTSRKARRLAAMECPLPLPSNPWVEGGGEVLSTQYDCERIGLNTVSPRRLPIRTPEGVYTHLRNGWVYAPTSLPEAALAQARADYDHLRAFYDL